MTSAIGGLSKVSGLTKSLGKKLILANDFSRYDSLLMIEVSDTPHNGETLHSGMGPAEIEKKYGSLEKYQETYRAQQLGVKTSVEKMGCKVYMAKSFGHPDGQNAMDPFFASKDEIYLASMGPDSRKPEVRSGFNHLFYDLKLPVSNFMCNKSATYEFGDFVSIGELSILIGKRIKDIGFTAVERTCKNGRKIAKKTLASSTGHRYKEMKHLMLHLSTALTYLGSPAGDEKIYFLANPDGINVETLQKRLSKKLGIPKANIVIIETGEDEGWSSGAFAKNGTVLMAEEGKTTNERVKDAGFQVLTTPTFALKDMDTSIHCLFCGGYKHFLPFTN